MALFVNIFTFLTGIVIGSFLNVCIYRIPLNKDIILTRSHCMTCGRKLRWFELIPIFSYVLQKGRCRGCGSKLSLQYPLIEAGNGICYLLIMHIKGFSGEGILLCILSSVLIVLSLIDISTYTIPFGISVAVFVLGILFTYMDRTNWKDHLLGMCIVSSFLFLLYVVTRKKGIGDGDIKLMIGAGLLLGVWPSLIALWIACCLGAMIHLVRMKVRKAGHQLAFGPYLSMGIIIAALWGKELWKWYCERITNTL